MNTPAAWVEAYLNQPDRPEGLDRLGDRSSGLDANGILAVLGDTRLGPDVIHAMSDLMHPTDSMYYDAIYGAFHGQVAIRNWLVPTMAEISFIEFVPKQPTEVFGRGDATSSVDEWQMIAVLDGERVPLPLGVSVRHYADGWITWNADVYDTGAFRTPAGGDSDAPPLPDPPRTSWNAEEAAEPTLSADALAWLEARDRGGAEASAGLSHDDLHAIVHHGIHGADADVVADLMHPTDSVLLDPRIGEVTGQAAIRAALGTAAVNATRQPTAQVGPLLFNGSCSVREWVQTPVLPDGGLGPQVRGTSVRRYRDGHITYAAEYLDTAVG